MDAGDRLLSHFDRITGTTPTFRHIPVAPGGLAVDVAMYPDFPFRGATTTFTIGLSKVHSAGGPESLHRELVLSTTSSDTLWSLACGHLASELVAICPFEPPDTINFGERISPLSAMTAFVVVPPLFFPPEDALADTGVRTVALVQLLPIYDSERAWLRGNGSLNQLLGSFPREVLIDPTRPPLRDALS